MNGPAQVPAERVFRGGLVQALTAPFALAVDAASYLISVLSLSSIEHREPKPEPGECPHLLPAIRSGFRFTLGNAYLRAIAGKAATFNLFEQTILTAAKSNVESAESAYGTKLIPFLSLVEAQRNRVMLDERYHEAVADCDGAAGWRQRRRRIAKRRCRPEQRHVGGHAMTQDRAHVKVGMAFDSGQILQGRLPRGAEFYQLVVCS